MKRHSDESSQESLVVPCIYPAQRACVSSPLSSSDFVDLCRTEQLNQLFSWMGGMTDSVPFGPLFLYGPPYVGKRFVVETVFQHYSIPHLAISSDQCSTKKSFLRWVLSALTGRVVNDVPSLPEFVSLLQEHLSNEWPTYLLIFHANDFAKRFPSLFTLLLRLHELLPTKKIGVVMVSNVGWNYVSSLPELTAAAGYEPHCIHFPKHEEDEIKHIIQKKFEKQDASIQPTLKQGFSILYQTHSRYFCRVPAFFKLTWTLHHVYSMLQSNESFSTWIMNISKSHPSLAYDLYVGKTSSRQAVLAIQQSLNQENITSSFMSPLTLKLLYVASFCAFHKGLLLDPRHDDIIKYREVLSDYKRKIVIPLQRLISTFRQSYVNDPLAGDIGILRAIGDLCERGFLKEVKPARYSFEGSLSLFHMLQNKF